MYLEVMDQYRLDKDEVLLDLEKQFYQRELSMPTSLEVKYSELCAEAETLVLDLLGRDGE